MATKQEEEAVPDFLKMEGAGGPQSTNPHGSGRWYGWPSKEMNPLNLLDKEGRVERVRTPVLDLEGLITPTELHYVVQHFAVPKVVPADKWSMTIDGEVKNPLTLDYEQLRRYPGRTVRTVMECSGSDATYFEYFKGEGPKPSRNQERMILSAAEWTGTPLDKEGRVERVRTPVLDLEGLITPTELHYVVQHFAVPKVVPADKWSMTIDGEVKNPLTLDYEQLRRYPGRTVRTVMECSGSDATYFEYFKGEGPKPSRNQERMILSAAEWTGTPLAAVLNDAGLTDKGVYIRATRRLEEA